eukprot:CAMPEP_0179023670 /NCGR_PEP_ID=MMETSP0796-20121207/7051_1 /TAXON_ID=73915 /ORGANISM="Pyrodinium bahamense, Strain pbaha01" /LENGTH=90 /DNA_ID=CAMNT_0020719591 /DNA_START=298 /DNA_END=570 /DNA_ORIENTATION=+
MFLTQFGPNVVVYVPGFYLWNGKIRYGSTNEEILQRLSSEYWSCCLRLWSFWVPTNFIMFMYVPASMQVLWISTLGVTWNTSLSLMYNAA